MSSITLKNAHEINIKLIPKILLNGNRGYVHANGNTFQCTEYNNIQIVIENPFDIGLFYDLEQMLASLSEMIFAFSGRSDSQFIEIFSSKYELIVDKSGFFSTQIGKRIYEIYGDQISNVYKELKESKHTTQAVINLFMNHPTYIGHDCTMNAQFLVDSSGKLNCYLNYRSIDVINYLKIDTYLYTILLCLLSKWLGMETTGKLIINTPKIFILDSYKEDSKRIIKQPENFYADISSTKLETFINHRKEFNLAIELFLEGYRNNNYNHLIKTKNLSTFIQETILILAYFTKKDNQLTFEKLKKIVGRDNPYISNIEFLRNV